MKNFICILFFTLVYAQFSFAQTDTTYQSTLTTMFEVSGTKGAYKSAITQMFSIFRQQYAELSDEIWSEFEKEFLNASIEDLVEMLVPVYQKYMTEEDLKEVINFYQSPAGIKFAKSTPLITQESMEVGQKWGLKIGEEFERKMKAKGY